MTKKTIKILFISHSAGLYGAEKSLLILLKNIDRTRFSPIVMLPCTGPLEEEIKILNIPVIVLPYKLKITTKKYKLTAYIFFRYLWQIIIFTQRLIKLIKLHKIDVVYTNTSIIPIGALAALIARVPHVWHIRELIKNDKFFKIVPPGLVINFIKLFSKKIIANSKITAEQFYSNYSSIKKIEVIYNGVEIINEPATDTKIDTLLKNNWCVAVIGTIQPSKGQETAIRALNLITNKIPNIKLLIIGDGEKIYLNHLNKLISDFQLQKYVLFTGFRKDIFNILNHCRILLCPSIVESFGRTIIEAMAKGIPAIGTNTGGIKEIIEDGFSGYLVPIGDENILSEKIYFLFQNPRKAELMGKRGIKIVKEKFNIPQYITSIEHVIIETNAAKKLL
ncbi:group 1 glycosyl transferase [Candidatus Omnitrophus magneticus]|uniref:Group 1 glycosyl transferase n=1 Tax=Candidatus Omnitrophus magneticus TaxID=1609969 RepID=A0A0F0CPI2_9BACT|nr:group 1 glycosyl transferase [Candidatus Omnitrophus magneticus]